MEPLKQTEQIIKKMTNELISQILKDIENEVLHINDKPTDINILTKKMSKKQMHHSRSTKHTQYNLLSLQEIKQSKLLELKQIERHEDILKKSVMLSTSNVSRSFTKLLRSQLTEQQMTKIKEILKKQKDFALQLQNKEKQLADYIKEKQKQDDELRKKILAEKCEQRKAQLKKQREELQKKKQQRKINFESEIKNIKELKQKKLLHQTMEEKFAQQVQQIVCEKQKAYQLQKERKKKVVEGIKEHQKHYIELKKEKQIQREKSMSKSTYELPTIKSKMWLKIDKKQQEMHKIRQWEQNLKEQNFNKRKVYSKQVKQLFYPKVKTNNLTVRQQISQARKRLDLEEQHKKGNQYMKTAHQNINPNQIEKMKKSLGQTEVSAGHSVFYKNYLSDLKLQYKNKTSQLTSQAFEQTAANQTLSQQQKLERLKKMLKLKQTKLQKSTTADMVDTIKSKLLVLKEMIR